MKQLFTILAALMLFVISAPATPTVILYQNILSSGVGGQFTADTSVNGVFQTFCVDVNHEFYAGTTYNYSIGNQTYVGSGDYLSRGTAYLYRSFLNGDLTGYNYNSANSAGSLQNVIWSLQGEMYQNSSNSFVPGNPFYDDVVNEFGSIAKAELPSNGAFNIEVMNLYDGNDNPIQSQLISVSEQGTWLVSCMGLLIPIALVNRRKMILCFNH